MLEIALRRQVQVVSQVLAALERWAKLKPMAIALRGAGREWTWSDLRDAVLQAADLLDDKTPATGPVCVSLDNGPAWVVTDLALIRLGRVSLPMPPFFTPDQRRAACRDAGATAMIAPGTELTIASQGVDIIALGSHPVALHEGTAKITYTSGSTGQPKGVCLSQGQMETVASALVETLGADLAGVHLPILPLGVLLENVAGLYSVILAGGVYHAAGLADVGFERPFAPDFARMVRAVIETEATSLILPPEILRGFIAAKTAMAAQTPRLTLVAIGGAKVSAQLLQTARAASVPVFEGYGLSECGSVVALNTPHVSRAGTVGKVLPHLDVMIGDDGEIIVGPRLFLGYVGGPAQTGPVRTGDIGGLDADGFLRVSGRKTNTLITAYGRNVAPEWVESELLAQPEIAQAMVFGEAQPTLGALIVPFSPTTPAQALQAAVDRANAALPDYARVDRWKAVRPFDPARGELTGNGRPRRAALLETHADFTQTTEETECPSSPA